MNATLLIASVKLHTTNKLTPTGKQYLCFKINGKSSQAAKCVKSGLTNKVIDYILSIDTSEQNKCEKGMLKPPRLKYWSMPILD